MVYQYLRQIRQWIVELNLFKSDSNDVEKVNEERLTTRIYIVCLISLLFSAGIIAAFTLRTVDKIVYSPSEIEFVHLWGKYSNTLNCPCSKLSITYGTFVTTHIQYHQVCSSQFVEQAWINAVYIEKNSSSSLSNDIRFSLSIFWQIIADFCRISKQTSIAAIKNFQESTFFNPQIATRQYIEIQARSALNTSLETARIRLTRTLLSIQHTTIGNQLVSGMGTNFNIQYNDANVYQRLYPTLRPRIFDNCSCLNSDGCPRPSVFINNQGQWMNVSGMMDDCLIVSATLTSSLECYYNRTCLSLLHSQLTMNIETLSTTSDKYFAPKSTVQMLLDELMIDELTIDIAYDSVYTHCNPAKCNYRYTHRFDILFIITTITGIFGGLSFVLYLLAPYIAKAIRSRQQRTLSNGNLTFSIVLQVIRDYLQAMPHMLREWIVTLNLFKSRPPYTPEKLHRGRITTRLFIILFIISAAISAFYIILLKPMQIVTVTHPSESIYRNLYRNHSATLQCPCSKLSVSFKKFLSVTYTLHEVCSSDLISPIWLNYLASVNLSRIIYVRPPQVYNDFRTIGGSYFQFIAIFCSLAKTIIENANQAFLDTEFINDRVLSPTKFYQQVDGLIDSFINSTRNDFVHTVNLIRMAILANQFVIGTNINTKITVDNNNLVTIAELPLAYINMVSEVSVSSSGPCLCSNPGDRCQLASGLFLNTSGESLSLQMLVGISIGCLPLLGFLESTISWWYNQTYIEQIRNTYALSINSMLPPPMIKSLNASIPSRFFANTSNNLLNEMFVETWISNNSRFDIFYEQCAPISCSYTIIQRRGIIVIILLLISIYGGLNKVLHLTTPLAIKIGVFILAKWRQHRNRRGK